jgi:type II restriction enzyme
MELGKGQWNDNPDDLEGLRQQFLFHMQSYDRILVLRALEKAPQWKYELVEIPKDLLSRARYGRLEMRLHSRQVPKPGYCFVDDESGQNLFNLYFDGGTERKLQIKNLRKERCRVHATWEFVIPKE